MQKTDVVVIGGGLIGSSVTYYLTKMGKDVILLERDDLASGASGACTSAISIQSKRLQLLEITLKSTKLYEQLAEELERNIELESCGQMIILENEEQMEKYTNFVKEQRMAGVKVELLSGEEARKIEPALSKRILGSTYCSLDNFLNPLYTVFGLAEAASKEGARIYAYTEAQAIRVNDGKIQSIVTNRGEIETDVVVNAAGPYASDIGKMVNLEIPITPIKGQEIITEPMPPLYNHGFIGADFMELKHKYKHAAFSVGFVSEQTYNGNIIVGATRELSGYDRNTTTRGINTILRNAVKIVPALKHINIIRTFAGLRPETPDGLPIISAVDEVEGFYIASGHGGDGVALAPITGKLVGELIVNGGQPLIDAFLFSRFQEKNY